MVLFDDGNLLRSAAIAITYCLKGNVSVMALRIYNWPPLLLAAAIMLTLASGASAAETERIGLKMFHKETGKLLYTGGREITRDGARVTERTVFKKPDGATVQVSATSFEGDSLKLISHELEDLRLGLTEKMEHSAGKVRIEFREARNEDVDSDDLDWEDGMAVSATILPLLHRNWRKIAAGGEVEFDLLVPSRQGTVGFQLKRDSAGTVNGAPVTVVVLEPDSFIIRALVDPMYFYVADDPPHRILRYVGRTSVKADDGKDQDLRVEYTY